MSAFNFSRLIMVLALAALLSSAGAASAATEVAPPEKRRPVVEQAERLAKPAPLAPLPAGLDNPFDPAAFGQPDPEELRAIAAAQAAASAASAHAKPSTDREFLQAIARRILPSGTLTHGGESWLVFGKKRLRTGDRLTVSYDGHDYEIELTAIGRTTFTLRLNRDEITRPIKPGKTP